MTFSPCFKKDRNNQIYWVTNWTQVYDLDDLDWHEIVDFVTSDPTTIGFGYMVSKGNHSRDLTSKKNRAVIWEAELAAIK